MVSCWNAAEELGGFTNFAIKQNECLLPKRKKRVKKVVQWGWKV